MKVDEMTPWVKVLAPKPEDLSLIPWPLMVEERINSGKLSSALQHEWLWPSPHPCPHSSTFLKSIVVEYEVLTTDACLGSLVPRWADYFGKWWKLQNVEPSWKK